MNWRALGDAGEPYPPWLRALDGKSGAYAIRTKAGLLFGPAVVYVGESHTGNLRKTLCRHFQAWSRTKSWWRGQFAPSQTDPGHTYDRGAVEVAVQVTRSPAAAIALQGRWIRALKPRDNVAGVLEEAPF